MRISQNVLTCPTAACFNLLDTRGLFQAGPQAGLLRRRAPIPRRALRPHGVGRADPGRRVRHRPPLRLSRRLDGGQPLVPGQPRPTPRWKPPSAPRPAAAATPGVIMPFPGGVAASGSKAGSRYSFTIASTYAEFCPTLREKLGAASRVAAGRRVDSGNHHQRPRPADDRRGHAGRHRRGGRHARPAKDLRPATTAAGWARALSICTRKSSRPFEGPRDLAVF